MISQLIVAYVWLHWSFTDFTEHVIDLKYLPVAVLFSLPSVSTFSLLAATPFYLAAATASWISPIFSRGDTAMILTALFTAQIVHPLQTFFHASILLGVYIHLHSTGTIQKKHQWLAPILAAAHATPVLI